VKVCREPGCPELAESGACPAHTRKAWAGRDRTKSTGLSGWQRQARAKRVIRRGGGICHLCGQTGATVADHVVPLAVGGADHEDNMRPVHPACHKTKTQAEARRGRGKGSAPDQPQSEPRRSYRTGSPGLR
jgi:5-methylcytosine-specific restriction enzyme A